MKDLSNDSELPIAFGFGGADQAANFGLPGIRRKKRDFTAAAGKEQCVLFGFGRKHFFAVRHGLRFVERTGDESFKN